MAASKSATPTPGVEAPAPDTVKCPFCRRSEHLKANTLQMDSVRAVFECIACGLFRIARMEEIDTWSKMKGRVPLPPPVSDALTLDPEVVARSTNIVTG